jgi:integrase
MYTKPPKFRKHARGLWFCHWAGKNHYFTRKRAESYKLFLKSIEDWTAWREAREAQRPRLSSTVDTMTDLAERFLEAKELERGDDMRRHYTKHLKRFLNAYGPQRVDVVRPIHIQAVKDEMLRGGYAPRTVNHDITAIKVLLNWGCGLEYIPPINLRGVKLLPLGPPPNKAIAVDRVRTMILHPPTADADTIRRHKQLAPWLAINYLCLMRPSEVIKVVHKHGEWTEDGIFRLKNGKTDLTAKMARHVVFSDEALTWLDQCQPVWSRLDSYSPAFRRVFGSGGPHPLRHSAATHLGQLGASRADIDLLLGHAPSRVSLTYAPVSWQPLRAIAAQLTLAPDA